ncbi:MAG: DUF1330 domain-containing protein [Hyphomicrobiales bacterium]|nr:DUF1330 domain-containing protein [Hyphomicrobiales bacterium]
MQHQTLFQRTTTAAALVAILTIGISATDLTARAQSVETATVIVMATPDPEGVEALKKYVAAVGPLLKKSGAKLVKNLQIQDELVGDAGYASVGVADFPSMTAASDFFASDEYQALIPLRGKAFSQFDVVVGK